MDIAVIGSNMVDLIAYINRMPEEGETVEAPDFTIGCGGKGANQAVAASRLGSDVLMVTRVGNDVFAANTIENFARNGIHTAHVLPTDATLPSAASSCCSWKCPWTPCTRRSTSGSGTASRCFSTLRPPIPTSSSTASGAAPTSCPTNPNWRC